MMFMPVQDAIEMIRKDYAEVPNLQLTFWQAQRLWNLSEELCDRALSGLVCGGFLVRTADGVFARPRYDLQPLDTDLLLGAVLRLGDAVGVEQQTRARAWIMLWRCLPFTSSAPCDESRPTRGAAMRMIAIHSGDRRRQARNGFSLIPSWSGNGREDSEAAYVLLPQTRLLRSDAHSYQNHSSARTVVYRWRTRGLLQGRPRLRREPDPRGALSRRGLG